MGWWIGLGVLILLAGLLGAACVRAALLKNPEKRGEPQPVDGEKAAKYAKDLSRMIRCETISVRRAAQRRSSPGTGRSWSSCSRWS